MSKALRAAGACALCCLAASAAGQDGDRSPDFVGEVLRVFSDEPSMLLTIKVTNGDKDKVNVYIQKGTDVSYVNVPKRQRNPKPGWFVHVWLKKGSRETAERVRFLKPKVEPFPSPPPTPPRTVTGPEVTLEAETFRCAGVEVKDLSGASGRALFFGQTGGRAESKVRLQKGTYEAHVYMQGHHTYHDAVFLNLAGQEFRFYQEKWNRLAAGAVKDTPQVLVKVPRDGDHAVALEFAETGVYVDRIVLRRVDAEPDKEGFIRDWLILAPIPNTRKGDGAAEILRRPIGNEANLRPRAGSTTTVHGRKLVWSRIRTEQYYINFNEILGRTFEEATAYATCTIESEQEIKNLELRMGSDDQGRVYLNGREVVKHTGHRPIAKDQDTVRGITLRKGKNYIVFKIVNGGSDWAGCLRFVQRYGKPVEGLRVTFPSP